MLGRSCLYDPQQKPWTQVKWASLVDNVSQMSPSCWWRMWACSAWLYWEDCWRLSGFLLTFGLCSFSLFWTFICSQFYTWESLRPVSCPSKPPKGIILGTPHCPVSYILQRLSVGQLTFYSFCTCSLVPTTSLSITYWVAQYWAWMDTPPQNYSWLSHCSKNGNDSGIFWLDQFYFD